MATNNFYRVNASKIYAIGLDYEQPIFDEDGNETDELQTVSPDEYEYKDQLNYIAELLEQNKGKFTFVVDDDIKSQHDNRNFCATSIASLRTDKSFGDVNIDIRVNIFSRSAYYEGVCLDYEYQFVVDRVECDDINEDIQDLFTCNVTSYSLNAGMLKIQGANAQKWFDKTVKEMTNIIENSFESTSTTFVQLGSFSNGEGVYRKCEK